MIKKYFFSSKNNSFNYKFKGSMY